MVVGQDGSLYWIQDAYTTSDRYPYAQRLSSGRPMNYIRNSVKVVVDAYNGSVDLYINDPTDPIIKAWVAAFPQMFKTIQTMPEDLQRHLRYPKDLFQLQANLFSTYHMDNASLVYSREDQWEIPSIDKSKAMEPYYTIMRLPKETQPEFILMLPFTPQRKLNLASWMVARNDGDERGQLVIYRFPKDKLIYGPAQVMNRINQDEVISEQRTLWDQQGSQAIFGTLLVIPIEESLIYVAPLYLRSGGPSHSSTQTGYRRVPRSNRNAAYLERGNRHNLFRYKSSPFRAEDRRHQRKQQDRHHPSLSYRSKRHGHVCTRAFNCSKPQWLRNETVIGPEYGRQIDELGTTLEKMASEKKSARPLSP